MIIFETVTRSRVRFFLACEFFYLPGKGGGDMAAEQDIEQIKPEECETFENDIQLYLRLFCEENQIEDMRTASQSVYNACLKYIQRHVFSDRDLLKDKEKIYNPNNSIRSTYNRYDYEKVSNICEYYIYISLLYDKEVSIMGFHNLTGINYDTLMQWEKGEVLSPVSADICKKLKRNREESLRSMLMRAKNPVGLIAILNHSCEGWDDTNVSGHGVNIQVLTASQLPRLDTQAQDVVAIDTQTQDIVVNDVK